MLLWPSFNICLVRTYRQTHTHTDVYAHCFHLSLSIDSVSQCLGRKIGLCRAQCLESPKAAHQIQFLQSVLPHFASHCSSHFKRHSLSSTSELLPDGLFCCIHGSSSLLWFHLLCVPCFVMYLAYRHG